MMESDKKGKKTEQTHTRNGRWTARRIAALIGIFLLLAMYGSTMVFALIGSKNTQAWLMASIYCTIAVPVLLYAMTLTAKTLRGRGKNPEIQDAYQKVREQQEKSCNPTGNDTEGNSTERSSRSKKES